MPHLSLHLRFFPVGLLVLLWFPAWVMAQSPLEAEINEQLWRPYLQSYASFDSEVFLALHTEDIVRVSLDGPSLYTGAGYRERMRKSFRQLQQAGLTRKLELVFTQRLTQADAAYETGYMKITTIRPAGQPETLFSRFEVVLRKHNGRWLVAIDQDQVVTDQVGVQGFANGELLALP